MSEQLVVNPMQSVVGIEAAFLSKGAQAAVFRPRFGQAHQQYFSPRWFTQAAANIAEGLFNRSLAGSLR